MSDYTEFFLNSKSSIVQLETLVIAHSSFTKTYYLVRNKTDGLSATLEQGSDVDFEYYPLRISPIGTRENLDFGIRVDLGDLGETLPLELDAVTQDQNFEEKPVVVYRTYRSDDLSAPLFGPLILQISSFSFTKEGATFEAKAPSLNINGTGELYTFTRFPMLRGFL